MSKKRRKRLADPDKPRTLHKLTLELYKNRPRTTTIPDIAKKTKLPIRWLTDFQHAKRPSVNRVQILYEYLTGDKLPL